MEYCEGRELFDYIVKHKQLKEKLDCFFAKITQTSDIWPAKRKFYEKTQALVEKAKTTNKHTQKLIKLFEYLNIITITFYIKRSQSY